MARIQQARGELLAALHTVGDDWDSPDADLQQVYVHALQIDDALQEEAAAYQQLVNQAALLSKQRLERSEDVQASAEALREWEASWQQTIDQSVLNADVTPQSIDDLLQDHDRLAAACEEAETLERSIEASKEYLSKFVAQVQRLVGQCSGQLSPEHRSVSLVNAITACNELYRLSQRAKEQWEVATVKRQDLQEVQQLVADYQSKIEVAEAILARLCQESGCTERSELALYERQATAKSELLTRLKAVEDQLRTLAGVQPLENFEEECQEVAPDQMELVLLARRQELEASEAEMNAAQQAVGRLSAELAQIGHSSRRSICARNCRPDSLRCDATQINLAN